MQMIVLLIALLSAIQYIPYFLSIARGQTRPSVSGWSCFALSLAVTIAASVQTGSFSILISTGLSLLCQFAIIVIGLRMGVAQKPSRHEQIILAAVVASILIWLVAGSPRTAILINLAVDVLGTALILKKLHAMPRTEAPVTWLLGSLGSALAAWHFRQPFDINALYLLTIFLSNLGVLLMIGWQHWARTRHARDMGMPR
ncbi:MAG: hypothetical protein Q4E06_08715 [Lautropia sp.]|nr:hypothetical protein [Lautropia sp.]